MYLYLALLLYYYWVDLHPNFLHRVPPILLSNFHWVTYILPTLQEYPVLAIQS